jgi:chemotaxis protein CheD
MSDIIQVNMSQIKVATSPTILSCVGLGSCIALVLYDSQTKVGGLAHVMLPHSKKETTLQHRGMYADTAVEIIMEDMLNLHAKEKKIYAKIFGGASMFSSSVKNTHIRLGEKNIVAVLAELKKRNIRLLAQDVGGNSGRTILFNTQNGQVLVETLKPPHKKFF